MQSVQAIKNEINKLSYPYKMELYHYTRSIIKNEKKQKLSLKESAELMKEFYNSDEELKAFSVLGNYYVS